MNMFSNVIHTHKIKHEMKTCKHYNVLPLKHIKWIIFFYLFILLSINIRPEHSWGFFLAFALAKYFAKIIFYTMPDRSIVHVTLPEDIDRNGSVFS